MKETLEKIAVCIQDLIVYPAIKEERKKITNEIKADFATTCNHMIAQAEKHGSPKEYINAIHDVKKAAKITDTVFDLMV